MMLAIPALLLTPATLVRRLCKAGAQVAFVARAKTRVLAISEETGARAIAGDIGRKGDIYPMALQITGNPGGLELLINTASSLGSTLLVPLADTRCEDLGLALGANLLGLFRLTKALFGALAAAGGGCCYRTHELGDAMVIER
ncbi:MAG: SDR family oxidoreductase [Alphaproteobacteria bacterium]